MSVPRSGTAAPVTQDQIDHGAAIAAISQQALGLFGRDDLTPAAASPVSGPFVQRSGSYICQDLNLSGNIPFDRPGAMTPGTLGRALKAQSGGGTKGRP
jgi:hypothetical protein